MKYDVVLISLTLIVPPEHWLITEIDAIAISWKQFIKCSYNGFVITIVICFTSIERSWNCNQFMGVDSSGESSASSCLTVDVTRISEQLRFWHIKEEVVFMFPCVHDMIQVSLHFKFGVVEIEFPWPNNFLMQKSRIFNLFLYLMLLALSDSNNGWSTKFLSWNDSIICLFIYSSQCWSTLPNVGVERTGIVNVSSPRASVLSSRWISSIRLHNFLTILWRFTGSFLVVRSAPPNSTGVAGGDNGCDWARTTSAGTLSLLLSLFGDVGCGLVAGDLYILWLCLRSIWLHSKMSLWEGVHLKGLTDRSLIFEN